MKCQIQWIDDSGKPTPDDNDAIAVAHHHKAIMSMPTGGLGNRVIGYEPLVVEQSFAICEQHFNRGLRAGLNLSHGGWSFTPIEL